MADDLLRTLFVGLGYQSNSLQLERALVSHQIIELMPSPKLVIGYPALYRVGLVLQVEVDEVLRGVSGIVCSQQEVLDD